MKWVCIHIFVLCGWAAHTQTLDECLTIEQITIYGNERTRSNAILRELTFGQGDSLCLDNVTATIEHNEYRLMNTALFRSARIAWHPLPDSLQQACEITIRVVEGMYLAPVPILEFADRNFNVWWRDQQRDLRRINYGFDFTYFNFTGRRDVLHASMQNGYTQLLQLSYRLPAIGKRQSWGAEASMLVSRNREVVHATRNNEQQFYRSETDYMLRNQQYRLGLYWRPRLLNAHRLRVDYQKVRIDDFVVDSLNAAFLLDGRTRQRMFRLEYQFSRDLRDQLPYPIRGYLLRLRLCKEGLGIFNEHDAFYLEADYRRYLPLVYRRWSVAAQWRSRLHLHRKQQAFYRSRALGYGDAYLRGYEYYVIDGMDFFMFKPSLRYELLDRQYKLGDVMPAPKLRIMPVRAFAAFHLGSSYVNDPYYFENNNLDNRWLFSTSLALDLVFYYDKVFHLEYSINQLGDKALYLHYQFSF